MKAIITSRLEKQEGPFNFGGRVLYYDNQEGQYYDPATDFYVEQDEMNMIHSQLLERLAK